MRRRPLLSSAERKWNEWPFELSAAIRWHHRPLLINQKRSYSQLISQCFRLLCHASRRALHTWSDVQRLFLILVCQFSNRGRGKSLRNESFRISQLTNKSTLTVTDASHGLHMPELQDDSNKLLRDLLLSSLGRSSPRSFSSCYTSRYLHVLNANALRVASCNWYMFGRLPHRCIRILIEVITISSA